MVGFLFGLALIVIINQIPSLFGIETSQGSGVIQLWDVFTSLNNAHILTLTVSAITFAVLLLFRRFLPRFPGTLLVMGIRGVAKFVG